MAETPAHGALVIDDEPAMRALLVDVLTLLAGVETVDVGLTGAEVVEALHRRDPAVKVVMLTGSAMEEDVARVRERGVTVLAKPITLDRLTSVVAEILSGPRRIAVAMDNDANAAAVGEQWLGAARGLTDFVFVALGTGIGSGVVLDGKLHRGAHFLVVNLGKLEKHGIQPPGFLAYLNEVNGKWWEGAGFFHWSCHALSLLNTFGNFRDGLGHDRITGNFLHDIERLHQGDGIMHQGA